MNAPEKPVRLTDLAHGGGCGCKLSPAVLESIIARSSGLIPQQLLVGIESSDDAAVYQINETQAIVATTDFFMPVVDDPFDFGAIAATNAISDVYAMGGRPLLALAIVGMPVNVLPVETIRRILEGGESVCAKAGIPVAGGHSIDSVEPIYGLVAIGLADPRRIKRNTDARPGDAIVLGKGLGVGIYSAAIKKEKLGVSGYEAMIASTTRLNTPGLRLAGIDGVHALTDVTGFGLGGHLLEICKGSKVSANLEWSKVPLLPGVAGLVEDGFKTGASTRNWNSYGERIDLGGHGEDVKTLITDPQTSGGLLVTCAPAAVPEVLEIFRSEGFDRVAVIGEVVTGEPGIRVV